MNTDFTYDFRRFRDNSKGHLGTSHHTYKVNGPWVRVTAPEKNIQILDQNRQGVERA